MKHLVSEKPSLKERILDFFKGAVEDYRNVPVLDRQAARYYKQFKSWFDDFAGKRQYGTIQSGTSVNTADVVLAEKTAIRFQKDFSKYPYDMRTVIKEYIESVDDGMAFFVKDAMSETNKKRLEYMHHDFINDIPANVVNEINKIVGFDVSNYGVTINGEGIHHINTMHGKDGKHDHSMREESDIARMQYIISNADSAEVTVNSSGDVVKDHQYRNADNTESSVVSITKRINGTYYVVCAVADSKAQKMRVKSAYITKKEVNQELDASTAPSRTSETNLDVTSLIRIPLSFEKVNPSDENSSKKSSDRRSSIDLYDDADRGVNTAPTLAPETTVGELRQKLANSTRYRVYSKAKIVSLVKNFSVSDMLSQKTQNKIADSIWQSFNSASRSDIETYSRDMAEFIISRTMQESKVERTDIEYTEAREIRDFNSKQG